MEIVGTAVDGVGVFIVAAGAIVATARLLVRRAHNAGNYYSSYRQDIGRAILLGLEFLIAGATAVGIGRPYCWGLAAFGEAGVDRVLALVQDEFVIIMRQAGTLEVSAINAKYLTPATRPVHALGTESGRKYDLAD